MEKFTTQEMILAVVLLAAAFLGGVKYGESHAPKPDNEIVIPLPRFPEPDPTPPHRKCPPNRPCPHTGATAKS